MSETVRFETKSPFGLADAGRPTAATAQLYRPAQDAGRGVVLLAGLAGPARETARAAQALAAAGVTVLAVDSAAIRGVSRAPGGLRGLLLTEAMMLADLFCAARWLATEAGVDAGQIAAAGLGDGGTIAVLAAYRQVADAFGGVAPFCAHLAVCAPHSVRVEDYRTTGAPVKLFEAGATTAADLVAGDLENGGSRVTRIAVADGVPCRSALPALRLTPQNAMIGAATGRPVTGRVGRAAALFRSAPGGRFQMPGGDALDIQASASPPAQAGST